MLCCFDLKRKKREEEEESEKRRSKTKWGKRVIFDAGHATCQTGALSILYNDCFFFFSKYFQYPVLGVGRESTVGVETSRPGDSWQMEPSQWTL